MGGNIHKLYCIISSMIVPKRPLKYTPAIHRRHCKGGLEVHTGMDRIHLSVIIFRCLILFTSTGSPSSNLKKSQVVDGQYQHQGMHAGSPGYQ